MEGGKLFWELMVGLLTGILSGFGVGGGSLLMLYLTMFAGVQQYTAGGINLLYFIACAPAALWSHVKNGLVERPAVLWCTLAGLPVSVAAAFLASWINVDLLRRAFGVLLLYIGVRELRAGRKKGTDPQEKVQSDL
ncbi:sulfite exporter TauE/SafE family protein [Clostridiaceae bacterium]|nr:sulfite exporter TauE/SafE family protein [Clostridiaceae bacterium]